MATATLTPPPGFITKLETALHDRFAGADVRVEHIRDSRYRFSIVWDGFSGKGHPERQRRVWAVVESVVPHESLLDIGMILTLAPEELPQD